MHVRAGRFPLPPGHGEISPKPVFDVFWLALARVVRICALEAMSVDAVDTSDHHSLPALDGFQVVQKLQVGEIGHCKAKSYHQLVRGRVN